MIKMIYDPINGIAIPDGWAMRRANLIMIASEQPSDGEMLFSTSNIFTSVRVLVKNGKINPDKVVFEFNGVEMKMDKDARIKDWQDGFLEYENNLLLRLI